MAVHLLIIRIDPGDSLLPLIQLRKLFPRNQAGMGPAHAILADLNVGRALLRLFAGVDCCPGILFVKRHRPIAVGEVERAPAHVLRPPKGLFLFFRKMETVL